MNRSTVVLENRSLDVRRQEDQSSTRAFVPLKRGACSAQKDSANSCLLRCPVSQWSRDKSRIMCMWMCSLYSIDRRMRKHVFQVEVVW
jgi:hypothetical protein